MKNMSKSMTPDEAAQVFYGQDETAFAEVIAKLTKADPRLAKAFHNTRKRFLDQER